ncbi:HAD family phosphatase [Amycolatopsis sp. NPDC004625]|uniref:HAD family hydrolase n=1 Tax=Amycolatopsis sp. NPDC004625 TaxID=3154670 RepID=UPI0033A2F21B
MAEDRVRRADRAARPPKGRGGLLLAATLFDLDETLADSAGAWTCVLADVAGRYGHRWTPADWAAFQGASTRHWSAYLARRCPGLTAEAVVDECVDGMIGALAPLPGAQDLVAAAARLEGVVSNSPRRYVEAAVTAFGVRPHLRVVVAGEDVEHGKPPPDPYLLAARKVGHTAGHCLAVEDSASGIRSAHAAGMTVLAVPNPATAGDFTVLELAHHQAPDAQIATKTLATLIR